MKFPLKNHGKFGVICDSNTICLSITALSPHTLKEAEELAHHWAKYCGAKNCRWGEVVGGEFIEKGRVNDSI